ncbi:MAG: hypothetical protein JHC54_10825 [Acinetobacter sp.]|nr:hypothetical protein [Acinetobacter sp.]
MGEELVLALFSQDDNVYQNDIKDPAKWKEYLKIKNDPVFGPDRIIIASNGESYDCITPAMTMANLVIDLPASERQMIIGRCTYIQQLLSRATSLRASALGETNVPGATVLAPYANDIVELLGQHYSITEVRQILAERYKVRATDQSVKAIRAKFIKTIEAAQAAHAQDIKSVRLSHKKSRLQELTELYNDRKRRYETSKSRDDYKLLLVTLEQIRKEVDGDKLTVNGSIDININNQVNLHLQKQLLQDMSLMDIIIARVAAKSGVDPLFLISRLRTSIYSKFTGFAMVESNIYEDLPSYPSATVYDFDKIKKANAALPAPTTISITPRDDDEAAQAAAMEKIRNLLKSRNA